MAPENLSGNLWKLLEGESVSDGETTINGPDIVRVELYDTQPPLLSVQGAGGTKVELPGHDFASQVKKS